MVAEIISSPNVVFWVVSFFALLSVIVIIWRPALALPIIFGWIAVIDFLKRLLWYDPNQSVPSILYQLVLFIPDVLLIVATLRAAFSLWVSRTLSIKPRLADGLVALFFIWSVLNIFNPKLDSLYLGLVGFRAANLYILTYFLARSTPQNELRTLLRRLAIVIAAGTLFAVIYTFIQVQVGLHPFEIRWLSSGETVVANQDQIQGLFGTFRPISTFANHEQLGWWLGTSIVFLSALIGPTWLYLLIAAPAAFVIIRTLSRSSWAFTVVGLGIIFITSLMDRSRQTLWRSATIAAVLVISFIVWTQLGASLTAIEELDTPLAGPGRTTEVTESTDMESFTARATTVGTLEWRVFTLQALLGDPSWRTLLGNGMGSMWYAARFNVEGAILATSEEVRALGVLNLPAGKRILSHIGLVDYIYELGIVGAIIFLAGSAIAIIDVWRRLRATTQPLARNIGFSFIAIVLAILLVNSSFANTLPNARSVAIVYWGLLGLSVTISMNPTALERVPSPSETASPR
ncbi:MAG: hypothetical protein KJ065_10925 [Anaerolineae bacterium]|nr:hypothetical protein [Anaerolineae bacterium]